MGTTFSMFDSTAAGAVAAIKAAILASTDWSNPAGDRVQCTTTRGAAMVVDLADAAATAKQLQLGVYRTTGLADKTIRYLGWRSVAGATSDPIHCTVSAGKEHIIIQVEGPRVGEPNPEGSANGSYKPLFFLCDLVPYNATDTVPAVVLGGCPTSGVPQVSAGYFINVSRNAANSSSWVQGNLETLSPVDPYYAAAGTVLRWNSQSINPADGTRYLKPYVVVEDFAGMRGRLSKFFYMGYSLSASNDFPVAPYTRVALGSETYMGVAANRSPIGNVFGPFGNTYQGEDVYGSPIIAIPFS